MTLKKRMQWLLLWPYSRNRSWMPWFIILPRLFIFVFWGPALLLATFCEWLSDRIPEPDKRKYPRDYFQ